LGLLLHCATNPVVFLQGRNRVLAINHSHVFWHLSQFKCAVTSTRRQRIWHRDGRMKSSAVSYKRHRFPQQIISNAVWLYFRFSLSLLLVEEMLERGIFVSYETMRRWGRKFGPAYAKQLRWRRPSRQDVWHLDDVVISIAGRKHWLGVPLIKVAMFSTRLFKADATRKPSSDCSSGY
jgi:hypothetical protein